MGDLTKGGGFPEIILPVINEVKRPYYYNFFFKDENNEKLTINKGNVVDYGLHFEDVNYNKVKILRGNNKKQLQFKNSFKEKIVKDITNENEEIVLDESLPSYWAILLNRVEVINGRGCGATIDVFTENAFSVYIDGDLGFNGISIYTDPQMTEIPNMDGKTIFIYNTCTGYNYDLGSFNVVPVF